MCHRLNWNESVLAQLEPILIGIPMGPLDSKCMGIELT